MTAIAALSHGGRVFMGGDSAGTAGHDQWLRKDEKVFVRGEFLFGFTSSYRMGQLIRYRLNIPKMVEGQSPIEFMSTSFIDALRECLKVNGWAEVDKGRESGGTFLVGHRGLVYRIESDYQVAISQDPFDACGSGQSIVLGVLYATKTLAPAERIKKSLEAASRYNAEVRPPFVVASL